MALSDFYYEPKTKKRVEPQDCLVVDEYNEVVRVAYISEPDRFINVAADSGIAMIRDIMRGMGIYA